MTDRLLSLVPRRCRTWPWLRRFYWQPDELAAVKLRAQRLAKRFGWADD